ncbi:TonB-dependent receptor [Flavobacterium tructae]|uniref:Ferrichrome-iron receptor n=1 Tax=Flavobacterium tructae TaxID=1114873 RepID=A0A1S1J7G4_9FLAO|nr:TonB-dependent receptor [Flavobacterium tructae]OHT45678.1 ferrichrome-iron receptor [Flavobacterium tructae]OXB18337.1 TonB-dependent siderophore receptor [Flavobacterium tructae]
MKYSIMKTYRFLLTISFLFSFFGSFAQQNFGKIKGTITTSDGDPAAGVNVILKNSKYGTVTNDDGTFDLNRVRTNTYTLQVSLTGYETTEQEVVVTESETTVLNLQLKVSNKELHEVVVNGKKSILSKKTDYVARMPLKNLENPQVYNVIPKELLQEQIAIDIRSAAVNAPGVTTKIYPSGGLEISFRGFSTGVNARNGMENMTGRSSISIDNAERIEVLKGPSGTLFGSSVSSFGGVVNLVTKKPFETKKTEVSYTGGSFGLNRLALDVNTPLTPDNNVLFRLNAAVNTEKSFLDYGFSKTFLIAPSLTYKATDKLTLSIDTEIYNVNNTRPTYGRSYASGITNPTDLKVDYRKSLFHDDLDAKTSSTKVFVQAEYQLAENWKSTTVFSFIDENVDRSYQYYTQWISPTEVKRSVSRFGPIFNQFTNIQENINGQFSTGSIKHKLLLGTNYRFSKGTFNYGATPVLDIIDVTKPFDPIRKKQVDAVVSQLTWAVPDEQIFSVYASDVISFTDRLSAMLSLRLDNFVQKKLEDTKGYNQTALSPKLGLVYEVLKNQVSLFGNYMNGFQNSGPVNQPDGSLLVLKPVYANQYEGGVKVEAFNKKLSTTLSYYNITIDNATRTTSDGFNVQDGKQVSKGIDFEFIATPVAGLNAMLGYAYNDNRIVKSSDAAIEGNKASGAPENVVNFWISYKFQNKLKDLGLGFGGNYVDKQYKFEDESFYSPSYSVYNATLFYDKPTWRIGVKFNNINNKKYWDSYGMAQAPANLLVNLTLKF